MLPHFTARTFLLYPWTYGPFSSSFGTFMMARSSLAPRLTATGPYPGSNPDPWPGPRYLGPHIPFEGSTLELAWNARSTQKDLPDQLEVLKVGSQMGPKMVPGPHGPYGPYPWSYPSSLSFPTDFSQANGLQPR